MDDHQVYLEKMAAFSRMLRLEGVNASHRETADACKILIDLGFSDRQTVKEALCAIYAKSREEQLIFDRVFDGFFVSEDVMRALAREQAQKDAEVEAIRAASQEQLQVNGQPMMLSEDQRTTFASMPESERQRLLDFLDKYKNSAERSPELYGNFIHSVFTKSLLEQQMRMEDAATSAAAADPEIGLLFRDISEFRDEEIPKAISMIQTIAQQINAELAARNKRSGRSGVLDFRKTIRKGLETGGTFYRLKYKKKPRRRRHMVILCDVSGSMIQFSEFALRFIQSLNQASESSKVFLFSESAVQADAFSLQNMDLFRDYVSRSGIYGKGTNLANALEHLTDQRPPILTDSTTLIILSDTKTVETRRSFDALMKAKHLCGKVIWLNPIPENRWNYLRSTQVMASGCTMISCSTLGALANACRRLATPD
ncbi:MAG: VWA domain-containing protein [Ruminococcaceae bacterium]|nr:VWA domain-containing protein [Oscillospiraceae bacterium]